MRKTFGVVVASLLLLGGWRLVCVADAAVDRVVAVVNQDIITLSEVEREMNALREEVEGNDRLERKERLRELRRKILDLIIEDKLIDQEAKKSGVKISNKEIESAVESIKAQNNVTQEDLEKVLVKDGITLDFLKKQIEKKLQRMKVVQSSVKTDTKIGDKELLEFYQKNVDRYRTKEVYRPSHILVAVPRGATNEQIQESRRKCQKVLEKIRKGEDFGEMAILYSEDLSAKDRGDLGYFKKGELLPAFEREASKLKPGEVSGIVRTDYGFHIIKVLDRKGGDPLPFEEVKERLMTDCLETEAEKAYRQFISTLRERSIIEIRL